jgi:hypothetical protein
MRCKLIILLILVAGACGVEKYPVTPARFEVITRVNNLYALNYVIEVYTSLMAFELWVLGDGSLRGTIEKDSGLISEKIRSVRGVTGMVITRKTGRPQRRFRLSKKTIAL